VKISILRHIDLANAAGKGRRGGGLIPKLLKKKHLWRASFFDKENMLHALAYCWVLHMAMRWGCTFSTCTYLWCTILRYIRPIVIKKLWVFSRKFSTQISEPKNGELKIFSAFKAFCDSKGMYKVRIFPSPHSQTQISELEIFFKILNKFFKFVKTENIFSFFILRLIC
jgi:hypothetical protein